MAEKKQKTLKINGFVYGITRFASFILAKTVFKRKIVRNEIKNKKGPFVIIANHECALDFVNLIGLTNQKMHFVISESFYNTLPVRGLMKKMGIIPKQQFQTSVSDVKIMKTVIDEGGILVLFPAGLMCEDGLSTPIPQSTYKFLKWLKADVFVARTRGSYFVMPKWTKGFRKGTTTLDVHKLLTKEELASMPVPEIKKATDDALLFDCYREQEALRIEYKGGGNIEGLENVLYKCPNCGEEFSISVQNGNELICSKCGYSEKSDQLGFLHKTSEVGEEIRYVSDWSKLIFDDVKAKISSGELTELSAETEFKMIDYKKKKFLPVGNGFIRLTRDKFFVTGEINGEQINHEIYTAPFASLPFSPGKHLEIQHGDNIYRCALKDGKMVMKFINMVKAYYELNRLADEN